LDEDYESAPQAENPLVRGLQDVLEATPLRDESELDDSLLEADELLSRIKRENRDAIRQANRQVRLRGPGSPNILLIVAPGLDRSDLGCYGNESGATPKIDTFAKSAVTFTQYRAPSQENDFWRRVFTGGARDLPPDERLPAVLWDSGYATYLMGDCTMGGFFGDADPLEFGFDDWLGIRDPAKRGQRYPYFFAVPGGAQVKIAANAGGANALSAGEFYTRATNAQLSRLVRGRPFFLMLVYPPSAGGATELDTHIGDVWARLSELRLAGNTIVMVTGMGVEDGEQSLAPMIVAAPRQKGKGGARDHAWGAEDILPTLVQAVSARRRGSGSGGDSAWPAIVDLAAAANSAAH
jgi:arylsulfatase A-like enzyme